ncbi:FAD-linked sulfhydryl oxidase ALR [Anthonomus grandis grandis]|uniref:FAD-linked sulfhydryl oxidase ALR n=1 Tax=Anthonomus grandis grandis TaxID=2921223 RepID=UPI002166B94E|nr:FAD-linked sulfhydryl oxidase ALR [Anthonomus grandis grandis]
MNRRPSPLDNDQCRSCSSFSDYIKATKKKKDAENGITGAVTGDSGNSNNSGYTRRRSDCPLDKDELGNKSWGLLHTMAANYPVQPSQAQKTDMKTFFNVFAKFYPCHYCAEDLREELKIDPPKVDSQEALSQWLCRLHNKVNVKIGKEVFDCSKVNERWRDGWLDGSCDY